MRTQKKIVSSDGKKKKKKQGIDIIKLHKDLEAPLEYTPLNAS